MAREAAPQYRNFVLSYPKAGRTWLRMLIGRYLCETLGAPLEAVTQSPRLLAKAGIPTHFTHGNAAFMNAKHYRELTADKSMYRDKYVLLLGRDVRDMVVSAYFHAVKRMKVFEGPISEFVRNEYLGTPKILAFYRSWHEGQRTPRGFLYLRYEEMHRATEDTLSRALRFLGVVTVDAKAVSTAVQFATFENLRKGEAEGRHRDSTMTAGDPNDPESYKFRRGKAGGYADYLSAEDIAYIDGLNARDGCEFTR